MSAAVDVTIFDGMPPVVKERVMERDAEGNVTRYEEAEYLPSDFKYPALCIASYSKQLGNALGSKNDWMCLCLDNYAYNWNKSQNSRCFGYRNIVTKTPDIEISASEW